jgi:thioredoxin-related protein
MSLRLRNLLGAAGVALLGALAVPALAQERAPQPIEVPRWFSDSFLDLGEEIRDAARADKRLMLYFGQDGCPYCRKLMVTNFSQRTIVAKTRQRFVPVALDIWGAREVTWRDGRVLPEKEFARAMNVQFTPTLLFFDERGEVVARVNGYYPPQQFEAVLDYAAGAAAPGESLADYLRRAGKPAARARLASEPFFVRPPHDLARHPGGKPVLVLFETPGCTECDELHAEGFRRREVRALLGRFDVAQFALGAPTTLTTPDGRATTADAWARDLGVTYTPTLLFFDDVGAEVFRVDAYLRPFHLASSLDYVASGAYRGEPSFQRYLQTRAEHIRSTGGKVELWK